MGPLTCCSTTCSGLLDRIGAAFAGTNGENGLDLNYTFVPGAKE